VGGILRRVASEHHVRPRRADAYSHDGTCDVSAVDYRSGACIPIRRVIIPLILCSLICPRSTLAAVGPPTRAPQEAGERPVVHVPASGVGHRAVIVGFLGLLHGTPLTTEGVWERGEPAKGSTGSTSPPTFVAGKLKHSAPPAIRRRSTPVDLNSEDLKLRTAKLKDAVLQWSVLEAALVDIIHWDEARVPKGGKEETIIFGTARPGLLAASELIDREEPPSELSAGQLQRAVEAAKDAAWAQHERDHLESFRPKDERITVLNERRPEAADGVRAARRREIIRAHTPGFSKDKQIAIVRVDLGAFIHRDYVTYVIGKDDGKWVVLARRLGSEMSRRR
jgi:hypothetical protein